MVRDRETTADIAATAFTAAFSKWDTFRGESGFYTWLFAIARNEFCQQLLRPHATVPRFT
jgi:DNA-directed RNA polymerase specialized sigma24 family protein